MIVLGYAGPGWMTGFERYRMLGDFGATPTALRKAPQLSEWNENDQRD
jgi:hypothetical protein